MMLMVVPDEPEESAEVSAEDSDSSQPKAQLDDSETTKASQKVELDLDDAPFLEDEDDEEELEEIEESPLVEEPEEKPKRELPAIFRNKLFYMGLIIFALLIIIAVLLFARKPAPQVPVEPEVTEPAEPEPQQPPVVEEEPEPEAILLRMDPFLVEQRDSKGNIRFLEVRVVVSTLDQQRAMQFNQETFAIRNALYYYLKNKNLTFLTDKDNTDKLKKELLAVINQYIGVGQFETLLFEQYFVR